jgi:hypothetical protein
MKLGSVEGVLKSAVYLGVGYALYSFFKKDGPGGKAADAVAGAIASPIATVSNWLYGSWATVPTGNVILPNGTKVPTANVHITWNDSVGVASFVYNGYGYIIRPNPSGGAAYDQNGDYHAE